VFLGGDREQLPDRPSAATPLVVSRFAVRITQRETVPDDEWIRQRATMLGWFTLPSLERSGVPGLRWALLVAPETYDAACEALLPVLARCRNTHPVIVRVEGEPGARTAIAPDLEPLRLTTDRVVTIRLDTDDALLPGTVPRLVRLTESAAPDTLVDLYCGYQYDTRSGQLRLHAQGRQGPFLALVNDRAANPIEAPEFHVGAREDRAVRYLHGESYIQVIHDGNVINTMQDRSVRSRVASLAVHREGGGRRAWTIAASNRDVRPTKARRVLESCGIDGERRLDVAAAL
jgi:hypothetical protein